MSKSQPKLLIPFARLSRAALIEEELTALADGWFEASYKAFLLVSGLDRNDLLVGAGDLGGFSIQVELDLKVGQVELFRIRIAPADGGLHQFNLQ